MKAIIILYALAVLILAAVQLAEAQQPGKVPMIGDLGASSLSDESARIDAFRQGLHDLGYVEGKNIVIEYRFAEGKLDRFSDLAAELVRLKIDIILTVSTPAAQAAKKGTQTIPIVMASSGDPITAGLVHSLARPGGNITGLSFLGPELSGKQLELLKEAFPKLSRVGILWNPGGPGSALAWKEASSPHGAWIFSFIPWRYGAQ